MKKGIILLVFIGLLLVLILSTVILTRNADKQANEQLRKDFFITIKKSSNFNETSSSLPKEGQSICKTIQQIEVENSVYRTVSFKCIYTFTNSQTSVPNNTPFDKQTCLAMNGIWIQGEC